MKLRTVISLSLVSLIAVVLIQLGGMLYAFHAQMQEAEKLLNKCFWMSFTETVDNLVNNLPYPDNSIAIIAYAPNPKYKRIDGNERNKRTSQQVAQALQRVYGIKEIPLATIDSVLHNKLRKLDMDGTLTVERINVNTNEVLATTNPQVSIRNFAAVTSETAFTFKSRGEAVRAILSFPAKEMEKRLLLLSFITWLLLGTAVYALIVQMKSVFRQRHDLQKQQQDFYTLAEEMKHPVSRMKNLITTENWQEIEAQSNVLFERTNDTLAHAKAEIRQGSTGRPISLKAISIVSLAGVFLLLAVWSGYLYYITSQKIRYQAEEQLEEAFYREADIGIRFSLRLILILIGIVHRENFSLIRGV